jgi:hypothetical protein
VRVGKKTAREKRSIDEKDKGNYPRNREEGGNGRCKKI